MSAGMRIEPVCGRAIEKDGAPVFGVLLDFDGDREFLVVRKLLGLGAASAARSLKAAWFTAAAHEAGLTEWEARP